MCFPCIGYAHNNHDLRQIFCIKAQDRPTDPNLTTIVPKGGQRP